MKIPGLYHRSSRESCADRGSAEIVNVSWKRTKMHFGLLILMAVIINVKIIIINRQSSIISPSD